MEKGEQKPRLSCIPLEKGRLDEAEDSERQADIGGVVDVRQFQLKSLDRHGQ